jgi:hypothetical protein
MNMRVESGRPFVVWLIVLMLIAYGLLGPVLLRIGAGSTATITEVRRTGGAEPQWFNQYWWVVAYEFRAADGKVHGGHTRVLAHDTGPRGYARVEPVVYLASAPWLNVLRKEAGFHAGTAATLGAALLILWLTRSRKTAGSASARRASKRVGGSRSRASASRGAVTAMTVDQSVRWLLGYRRQSRLYAWLFFAAVIPVVLLVIWLEMGELNDEVLGSLAFFILVFLALALGSRRQTSAAWRAVVVDKQPSEQGAGGTLVLALKHGKQRKLRVSSPLFDYFAPGDAVFKLDGFEWPEKWEPDAGRRACIACGGVIEGETRTTACPHCGAPLPAHEAMQTLAPRA